MAFSKDLTKPVKESFTEEEDTKVVALTEDDVGMMWHADRGENGFSETADEVKGFFDYIPRRVLFPWLQGAAKVVNKLSDRVTALASRTVKQVSMSENKLQFVFEDGTTFESESLKGDTGPQGPQGETGATGATGAAGPAGADGRTPVKGTDYWTEEDKAEIKAYVDEAILGGEW